MVVILSPFGLVAKDGIGLADLLKLHRRCRFVVRILVLEHKHSVKPETPTLRLGKPHDIQGGT